MLFLKVFFILCFSVVTAPRVHATEERVLKTPDKKIWRLVKSDSFWVSSECKKDCKALKPADKKKSTQSSTSQYLDHPAASFCQSQNGSYITGEDEKGNQDGLCVFRDGSYILGWDYFERNNPQRKKK